MSAEPPKPSPQPAATPPEPVPPASQPTWGQVDDYADRLRLKLPLAPEGVANAYMAWVPWLAIVFGTLGALISGIALAGASILGPVMVLFGATGSGFGLLLGSVVSLAIAILEILGGIGMLRKQLTGWWILALGIVVSLLSSLVHVSVFGLIVGLLIVYLHLAVKPNYS